MTFTAHEPVPIYNTRNNNAQWLAASPGVVEKSNSPHSSPLLLVKKKPLAAPLDANGNPDKNYVPKVRWRTCVDYVQLNDKSQLTDISNAPRVDELLEHIGHADSNKVKQPGDEYWVSTVDLFSGFNQWTLSAAVRPLTAFTIPGLSSELGRLQFCVLPFGLASAPTRFNTLVATSLGDLRFGTGPESTEPQGAVTKAGPKEGTSRTRQTCTSYIDDVFIAGIGSFQTHLQDMHIN